MKQIKLTSLLIIVTALLSAQVKGTFLTSDSVTVTYDEYFVSKKKPCILLCHQATYSRGEYAYTAKVLNKMGYNCVAIDQRSGAEVNGVVNETAKDAEAKKKGNGFEDAEIDIKEAIYFFSKKYNQKMIVWGSSYSASLVLKIAAQDNSKIRGLICFSPGNYLKNYKLSDNLSNLNLMTYVYCAQKEIEPVMQVLKNIPNKRTFKPIFSQGTHGSKVLWADSDSAGEYWPDVKNCLKIMVKTSSK
jgi:alpha-beta hydrolase superfamily lysophospholipase